MSLKRFGICVPILIDSEGRIVHGHVVWEAARRLGLETIPVIQIDHLNESERRALSIALNRLAETGDWDIEALKVEFEQLIELDEDILATGFELAEIDALLLEEDAKGPEAEDLPLLPQSAVSQPEMFGFWGAIDWFRATHAIAKPISCSSCRMKVSGSL